MRKGILLITMMACAAAFTSCANTSEDAVKPLIGLEWFTSYDDVKGSMDSYTLLEEREKTEEKVPQKMQDYTGVALFDYDCDLTLCFTDSGLIGFNYHDINRNQNYKDWYSTLESEYGLPTEEGSGMASWYSNPLGKDTAIYLFNLEEGVQVSFYATADSPDRSYNRVGDVFIPTPEIRTPVVLVELQTDLTSEDDGETLPDSPTTTISVEENLAVTDIAGNIVTDVAGDSVYIDESMAVVTDTESNIMTDTAGSVVTERVSTASTARQTTTTTATTASNPDNDNAKTSESNTEEIITNHTNDFLLNGLQFYGSPDSERRKMNSYTQLYEYRTEEPGQPWELIMEYENVSYEGKNCDGVLCFTSLGLVGINYFDSNTSNYNFWVQTLTEIYGSPDETQYDYTAWSSSPVGSGTMIYVFALEDGVQISFFADDTGSELA